MNTSTTRSRWWLYVVLSVASWRSSSPVHLDAARQLQEHQAELRQSPRPGGPRPVLDNYPQLFSRLDFARTSSNSAIVAVVVTAGNLLFCSMLGYALAKLDFPGSASCSPGHGDPHGPGRGHLRAAVRPGGQHGLLEHPARADPAVPGDPFGVFLMRQFISGLPDELIDAARVDGAGELRIFSKHHPAAVQAGPGDAGDPHLPRLLEQLPVAAGRGPERETRTPSRSALALYSSGQNATDYGLLLAGASVVVMPGARSSSSLFQRKFIEGIATTGIK